VTAPGPRTKLDEARDELHGALALALADCGWPPDRAQKWPPRRQITPPAAFLDVPTMHQAATEAAAAVAVTFPVVVVVNGDDQAQVQQQDGLLAACWQRLSDVDKPRQAKVQTGGPEDVDVGGAVMRGLVLRVQMTLATRTLCPQTLAQQTDGGTS
jgi:hypothetical protein